jgi:WSC domain
MEVSMRKLAFVILSVLVCGCGAPKSEERPATSRSALSQGQYIGCFTDSPSRALPVSMGSGFSVEACLAAAYNAEFKYAGLQYYGQCFAGNDLGYTRVADSECNTPCDANSSETCGGVWRNSVYQTYDDNITAVYAEYGSNCGVDDYVDLNPACAGKSSCSYVVDYRVIGDPAPGCAKNFAVQWRCGATGAYKYLALPPEAGFGSVANLTCP